VRLSSFFQLTFDAPSFDSPQPPWTRRAVISHEWRQPNNNSYYENKIRERWWFVCGNKRLVNKDLSLEHPIPFHLCNGLINVMLHNIFIRRKRRELISEVKREFDSKGTEKENHCQSEKQFTWYNMPHHFIYERNTSTENRVLLDIGRFLCWRSTSMYFLFLSLASSPQDTIKTSIQKRKEKKRNGITKKLGTIC